MTQDEWLELGIAERWCSPVVCETHDGIPMTPAETEAFEDGWDPCIPAVRLWELDSDPLATSVTPDTPNRIQP